MTTDFNSALMVGHNCLVLRKRAMPGRSLKPAEPAKPAKSVEPSSPQALKPSSPRIHLKYRFSTQIPPAHHSPVDQQADAGNRQTRRIRDPEAACAGQP